MGWHRETERTERWSPGLGMWQISDGWCDSWVVGPKTSFPENIMNPVLEILYLKCPGDSQVDNWWGWVYLGFKGVLQGFWIGEDFWELLSYRWSFPGGASDKESACQCRRCKWHGFLRWVGKIPWRRARHPTPVFLPGDSHGQRSLTGCSS